jgi:hypothetical protein
MSELGPRDFAQKFLEIQIEHEVIPVDDHDMSEEMFWGKRERRHNNNEDYKKAVEEALKPACLSPFFRCQIIFETVLSAETGVIDEEAILMGNDFLYGINVPQGRYGFFVPDQQAAIALERQYLQNFKPLIRWRMDNGRENPVSLPEWEEDLEKRLSQRN